MVVDRTNGWSGAELVVAIEEAMSRSLPSGTDALRQDLLLEVITERYVVRDDLQRICETEFGGLPIMHVGPSSPLEDESTSL